MAGWGCRSCCAWNRGAKAKCYHCSAPNPGLPGFSGGPGPGRRGAPRGAWAWGPGKAAAPPWRRQPAAPPAPAVLDDQQLECWVAMEDEKFAQLASVLGQSLRDRITHRRRLRAAGAENPRGKDLPQPVVKAQRAALQATQRLERAQQAALEAAEELEAAEAQLVAARVDLEHAKQDAAADTAGGDQGGPPVSASTWDDLGKLAGLVNQLAATYEDQLAQVAAGNKPPDRPPMEGCLGARQLTSPWELHLPEDALTPRSGFGTKQRLQNDYGETSGTGPARTKARMFFGNITQYGPTARRFLEGHGAGFDVVAAGRPPPFFGIVPMVRHLLQGNVLAVVAHLASGLRFRGANHQRLASLAAFLSLMKDPFVIVGDWNVEPTDWGKTERLQRLGATVAAPANVRTTCDKGKGKLYDYVLASSGYAEHVNAVAEPSAPRRTHCGLVIELTSSNRRWYHQALALPSALPLRCPPKVAAGPGSRRQRRLAVQASKRREALPEELRQSHDALLSEADGPGGPAAAGDIVHAPFPLPDYTAPWTGRWCSAGGGAWSVAQCCGDAPSAATAPVAVRRTSMDGDVDPMDALPDEYDGGFVEPPEHDPAPCGPVADAKSAMSLDTECAAAVQAQKPSSQRPADQDHFLFARVPLSTDRVLQVYAQWVGTLEEALIQTEQVAGRSADTMRGRGQGYRIEERRMKSTPGRAHLLDPVLEGWQTLCTLLVRLVALLTNG
ncbi:unnamed protein product, partial [Prorocentrum cordatum]